MSNPHILFVTGEYPPQLGGVGAYTAELGKALATLGCTVSVLTGRGATDATSADAPVRVYPQVDRWDWRIWRSAAQLAASIGADWIHVQYQTAAFAMNPAVNFAPARWRRHLRVGWTYHDLLVPYLFPKAGAGLRRWVTEWPASRAHLTVVTNEGDRQQLAEHAGVSAARIPIGSNIHGRRLTPAECAEQRARRGYGADELVVGYFGFLNRSKGGITLVHTLDALVRAGLNAHLLMIGERVGASDPTNFAYLQEVEQRIARLDLAGRVQWTGRQEDDQVGADLNACDVLLMPYQDGASLRRGTLMAGLANGCAVVTTRPQAPLPELVDGRDLIYIPPDDPSAAAAAIQALAAQPHLRAELGENARARSALFTWSRIAQEHLALYHEVAACA